MYLILLAIFRPFCLLRIYRILGELSRVDFVDVVPGTLLPVYRIGEAAQPLCGDAVAVDFLPFSSLPSLPRDVKPGGRKGDFPPLIPAVGDDHVFRHLADPLPERDFEETRIIILRRDYRIIGG